MTTERKNLPPFVGRADLVRTGLDMEGVDPSRASWFGFEYDKYAERNPASESVERATNEVRKSAKASSGASPIFCSRFTTLDPPKEKAPPPIARIAGVAWANRPKNPPPRAPLLTNEAVTQLVEGLLRRNTIPGKPDLGQLVRKIARAQPLQSLPRRDTSLQAQTLQLVVDRASRLAPIWEDQTQILIQIKSLFPDLTVLIWQFDEAMRALRPISSAAPKTPSAALGPTLAISDLGTLGRSEDTKPWRNLARAIAFDGGHAIALVPFRDTGQSIASIGPWTCTTLEPSIDVPDAPNCLPDLLALASSTVRLEPGLLRALRLTCLETSFLADEIRLWQHEALRSTSAEAASLTPEARATHRARLLQLAEQSPERVDAALTAIRAWRHHCTDHIWFEELLGLPKIIRENPDLVAPEELAAAKAFFANMHFDVSGQDTVSTGQQAWLSRVGVRHREVRDGIWADPNAAAAMQASLTKDPSFVPPILPESDLKGDDWYLELVQDEVGTLWLTNRRTLGAPLGTLTMNGHDVQLLDPKTDLIRDKHRFDRSQLTLKIQPGPKPFIIQSDRSRMVIDIWPSDEPLWADTISEDHHGVKASVKMLGHELVFRWIPPGFGTVGPGINENLQGTTGSGEAFNIATGFWLMDAPLTDQQAILLLNEAHRDSDEFKYGQPHHKNIPYTQIGEFSLSYLLQRLRVRGLEARLPTTLEWEYACRSGELTELTYNGTPDLDDPNDSTLFDIAWFDPSHTQLASPERGLYELDTAPPVRQKQPNRWGLFDMLGNVWEVCDVKDSEDLLNPTKGGSYRSAAIDIRAASEKPRMLGGDTGSDTGFRFAIGEAKIENHRYLPREEGPDTKSIKRNRTPRTIVNNSPQNQSETPPRLSYYSMMRLRITDAAVLAEASYHSRRITSPRVTLSLSHNDVVADVLEGDIVLLPGSNDVRDYLKYNLRPLRLGSQTVMMSEDRVAKGSSGTHWHAGFLAYANVVARWLNEREIRPKFFIGHSLGAAAVQILTKTYSVPGIAFGAPRVKQSRTRIKGDRYCLIINRTDDVVTRLPGGFNHVGKVISLSPKLRKEFPRHSMRDYRNILEVGVDTGVVPEVWSGDDEAMGYFDK